MGLVLGIANSVYNLFVESFYEGKQILFHIYLNPFWLSHFVLSLVLKAFLDLVTGSMYGSEAFRYSLANREESDKRGEEET